MKQLLIVANPMAGDGYSQRLLRDAHSLADQFNIRILSTGTEGSYLEALQTATHSNTACIVLFGGDGTVNRCLGALLQAGLPVAVFPAGTVNDLALELGMTQDWKRLGQMIQSGRLTRLPLIEADQRPLAVYGSIGLGVETSKNIRRFRSRSTVFRHAFPTLQTPLFSVLTLMTSSQLQRTYRLTLDGKAREIQTAGLYIVNQRFINRRLDMEWTPTPDQQRFRVVFFKPQSRPRLIQTAIHFARTAKLSEILSNMEVHDVESAIVESLDGTPIGLMADGELKEDQMRWNLARSPRSLSVFRGGNA